MNITQQIQTAKLYPGQLPPRIALRPFESALSMADSGEAEILTEMKNALTADHAGGMAALATFYVVTNEADRSLAFRHVVIMDIAGDRSFAAIKIEE